MGEELNPEDIDGIHQHSVTDWEDGAGLPGSIHVPRENPVELLVDGRLLAVLHCTSSHLDELAAGYLLGQGLVDSYGKIAACEADAENARVSVRLISPLDKKVIAEQGHKVIYSGCVQASGPSLEKVNAALGAKVAFEHCGRFDPATVRDSLSKVLQIGEIYRRTRGIHSAAVCSRQGKIMVHREDIGRHNALDKVLGWTARHSIDPGRLFVAATGRISSEAVAKLTRFGIPLMVARGVPTSLALTMAGESGITLAGSLGPGKLRVYTHPVRLGI